MRQSLLALCMLGSNLALGAAVDDNYTVLEDAPWTTFLVLQNDTGPGLVNSVYLAPIHGGSVEWSAGTAGPDEWIRYHPLPNYCGESGTERDAFRYDRTQNGGNAKVTVTITCVNDAPTFTPGVPPVSLEDSGTVTISGWARDISTGPFWTPTGTYSEPDQTVTFAVSSVSNSSLFSTQPTLSAAGELRYRPASNKSGSSQVTIRARDDGGTANGGANESAPHVFTIAVDPVNDPPSFTKGSNPTVLEDAGAVSIANWATAISPGPGEGSQSVSFEVDLQGNGDQFQVPPAVSSNGTLSFTPAANHFGLANIRVRARDNGGTSNGGVDVSPWQGVSITITAVNDPPTVTFADPVTVLEDSGAQTIPGYVTSVSPGPGNEAGQTVSYSVTSVSIPSLFAVAPVLSSNGTLTFTPAPNAFGSSAVNVTVTDNGGTANGGSNSAIRSFQIGVNNVNDPPSFTPGGNQVNNEDAGPKSITNWANNISRGP